MSIKQTCLKDGGDGDAWVEPKEFPQLLANLFYFNKLFQCFEQVDADDDRRIDEKEFIAGLDKLGMRSSDTTQVTLEGVRVPQKWRIGREGHGFMC